MFVGRVGGLHARQPLPGVDGDGLIGRLAGLQQMRVQRVDVVAYVSENLADPVLKLQVYKDFGHFVANTEALLLEQVGGFGQATGNALETL